MVAAGLLVLSLLTLALGRPTVPSGKAKAATVPSRYTTKGAAQPEQVLSLRIALAQSDPDGLRDTLLDVASPKSKKYGKWLTKAEVAKYSTPKAETIRLVNQWLGKNNVTATAIKNTPNSLAINIPVAQANKLLGANFVEYKDKVTGEAVIRSLAYSVPKKLAKHIDYVYPVDVFVPKVTGATTQISIPRKRQAADSCNTAITPQCLQDLYKIPKTPVASKGNTIGVAGFQNNHASTSDLQGFLRTLRPDASNTTTFDVAVLDGGVNDENAPSVEGSLDVQYAVGIATEVPATFFVVGDENGSDLTGFLNLVNALIAQENPPSVLTTSFGFPESLIPADVASDLCQAYAQLGARGTSIFFSSGDSGVDDGNGDACTDGFHPTFPSGCPFVTVVGATQNVAPEVGADFSSGGFSRIFAAPAYQTGAISSYLGSIGNLHAGLFETRGRGFPDVAAAGVNYQVNIGGRFQDVSGTSASTPLFASIVALLNDRLAAAGKPTLGFMNPLLYSAAGQAALNDITEGNNPGCGTDGFPAKAGWDPVTGLGTPDFEKLLKAVGL